MKPLGIRPVRFPCKTDCHPGKGFDNWWEVDCSQPSNKRARFEAKKQLIKELEEDVSLEYYCSYCNHLLQDMGVKINPCVYCGEWSLTVD